MAQRVPVIVGVGQVLQREEDPSRAAEPLALMVGALERAGEDAGAPRLLARAGAVHVPRGTWRYGDPGRAIAQRLGAGPIESVGAPYGGNYSHACVIEAARAIAAGRHDVVLVAGAENGRAQGLAQRRGIVLRESEAPGAPDRMLADYEAIFHDAELARGMNSASDVFAIVESAIRFARRETPAENARRIAALWARCAAVAEGNPNAWIRRPPSAREIGEPSEDNPMISYPYTRLLNANARVDMAAGLVLCSLDAARAAGVPADRCVFPHAAAQADDSHLLSTRHDLHTSPAVRDAGARVLDLAGLGIGEIAHVDLYSCFPSSVEVAAAELGLSEERPLTVTGGLTFGGGPLNSYALHAVARMVEVLRADPGRAGLIHANGGWLAKHALAIYASAPPERGFRSEDLRGRPSPVPLREALVDWDGPVTIEGYTVAHQKGRPRLAHAACLTDDGRRTWATSTDPSLLEAMMREEHCGRRGRVDGRGGLTLG